MAQVFVSYARKDQATALPVINALKQAGLGIWDDAAHPSRKSLEQPGSVACVLMLWSKQAAESPVAQQDIQRAVQAWSSDRLVLAALDHTPLPMGLRDLSAVPFRDASDVETKRLIDRVRAVVADGPVARPLVPLGALQVASRKPRRSALFLGVGILLSAILLAILAVGSSFFLRPDMAMSPSPHGRIYMPGAVPQADLLILLIALALGTAVGGAIVGLWKPGSTSRSKREPAATRPQPAMSRSDETPQLFISYSRRDERAVDRLVRQLEQLGYVIWIDRQSTGAQRYAAPIVRAIRSSGLVALMCSENAFASDHVIREVYVAGDYKKPFIAFELDPSEFPDEIRYFVSGFPRIPAARIDLQQLRSEIARLIAA